MKINSSISSVGTTQTTGKPKSSAHVGQQSAPNGDQVALSSLSARLQEVTTALSNTPVVDANRVAEVKQAISEGRFQVNPERVADSLIESVRQMLARQQG